MANAAIVPADPATGAINVFVTDPTDVVIDIDGYFAQPGGSGALTSYSATPCRLVDTRDATGALGGPNMGGGETRTLPILSSSCGVPAAAQAYSLNATVVPSGRLDFLSLWPAGVGQPLVSTLNAFDGSITANAAIVPAGTMGALNAYVTNATALILDINGYFAP